MGVVDEVKQKLDIVDVVGQYTKLTKSGRTSKGLCPFHSEKDPSFFVYPEQQSWHCFGACATGGDVFSFIMRQQGIDFGEALRLLAQRAGVVVPSRLEAGRGEERQRLYQANEAAARYYHGLLLESAGGEKAKAYVTGRGLSPQTIADFMLGYAPEGWEDLKRHLRGKDYSEVELLNAGLVIRSEIGKTHDRFRHKLMFPICDERGRVTGFGARALDDSFPKYVNSPQTLLFDKSGTLYGINRAKEAIREQGRTVIVEGYMDVIVAHQYGFGNVVASMGTAITERQVSILKRLAPNLALALDADAAGEEAMLRSISLENTLDTEVRVIILPPGRDPDEVIKEDRQTWEGLVAAALPVVDYTFDMATAGLDLASVKDKMAALGRLFPVIEAIKEPVRRGHYLQKLGRITGVDERQLEASYSRFRSGRRQESRPEAAARALSPIHSSPVEEYCLALLLAYPELKDGGQGLVAEHFDNSENREIFDAWRRSDGPEALKARLEPEIHGHLERLLTQRPQGDKIELRFAECALRLREKYLRGLKTKARLAQEAEATLGINGEQEVAINTQLKEVQAQRKQMSLGQRGVRR